MRYRRLGSSGLQLSALSFGAWLTFGNQVPRGECRNLVAAAWDHGINFFDNAEGYASGQAEIVMGNVLKQTGWPRESVVISTKLFWGGDGPNATGLSHKHLLEGIHRSLRRLQLDYVDLLFCHRPDPNTPIEETVRAMDIIIRQGKAFYWGTSEWSAADIMRAHGVAREYGLTPPSMEQPQYNLFERKRMEQEYRPLFRDLGYGTTIFSPLASGLLTGKYNEGIPAGSRAALKGYEWIQRDLITPDNIARVRALQPVADELGASLAQMALAWCLKNPDVSTVITGASRPQQVDENVKALDVAARLTPEVLKRIDGILSSQPDGR